MQNSDIEKCILMAASDDNFILEIFLNSCFSKTTAKIYLFIIIIIIIFIIIIIIIITLFKVRV